MLGSVTFITAINDLLLYFVAGSLDFVETEATMMNETSSISGTKRRLCPGNSAVTASNMSGLVSCCSCHHDDHTSRHHNRNGINKRNHSHSDNTVSATAKDDNTDAIEKATIQYVIRNFIQRMHMLHYMTRVFSHSCGAWVSNVFTVLKDQKE